MIPIIAFDSPDKCGKDTLIREFHKATDFKYPCINRFTGTSYSYGKFWNRDNLPFDEYIKLDASLFDKVILIKLDAPQKVLAERFKEHDEKDIAIEDMARLKNYYDEYLEKTPLFHKTIDTSQDIKKCVDDVIYTINNFENESPISKWRRLCKAIKAVGEEVSGTKELRDVQMNFDYGQINENELKEYLYSYELWDPQELYEFDEIKHSIINQIRLKLWYFKNQDEYSRQLTYNSDSCISFIQVLKRNDELEFYFTIRSSNAEKMLLQDIWGLNYIADSVNQTFFNLPYKINLRIISAHIYDNNKTNSKLQEL